MKNPILENISALLCVECGASEWNIAADRVPCKSCEHRYPIILNRKMITESNYIYDRNGRQ